MGSDCDRQKARLHWLQEAEAWARRPARGSMIGSGEGSCKSGKRVSRSERDASLSPVEDEAVGSGVDVDVDVEVEVEVEVSPVSEGGSLTWDEGFELADWCLISIIVLLLKQVHLQKVGAAMVGCQSQREKEWDNERVERREKTHLRRPPARRTPLGRGGV